MASQYIGRLAEVFNTHRTASLSALGIAIAIPFAVKDYLTFMAYGPSGLPYNAGGWIVANIFRVLSAEQFSTSRYDDRSLPLADEPPFLPASFPPPRASSRPRIGPHPIPQRQLAQVPSEEVRQRLIEHFTKLGRRARERGLVEVRKSHYERRHDALYVSKTRQWHATAQATSGEIGHVHAGLDGSIHVVLHPADCKAVFEAGWGQRHALSGVQVLQKIAGFALPVNYVLIYAPRDDAEIKVAMAIVEASIGFMTGSREELE